MSKRTRKAKRAKRAKQHPFKRPHPDPWKSLPPADDLGVGLCALRTILDETEPRVLEHPGVLAQPHFTDDQGVVRAVQDDPVGALSAMLRDAGARVTLDPRANNTEPCWCCGTTAAPRGLEVIGRYSRYVGGNLEPGDAIRRPLCGACNEDTRAGQGGDLAFAEALAELKEERALRERLADICTRTVDALRGPHPTGGMWGWHDLPELAAAAAPLDLDLFAEAFMSVIDEKPGDVEEQYEVRGEIRHRPTVLARLFRRAGVTTVSGVFARVLVIYDAWRAARRPAKP